MVNEQNLSRDVSKLKIETGGQKNLDIVYENIYQNCCK